MDFVLKNDQSDDPVCETKHPHYPQVKPKASDREADLIRSPLDVLPLLVQMRGIECVPEHEQRDKVLFFLEKNFENGILSI